MLIAIDTNVLLRLVHQADAEHPIVANAVLQLMSDGHQLCCMPQNIVEFWSVSTRPASARGGFGLNQFETANRIDDLRPDIQIFPDHGHTFSIWRDLVIRLDVKGAKVHDARLAAALFAHGITHLLTWDQGDFKRFDFLTYISPRQVLDSTLDLA